MGMLVDGVWHDVWYNTADTGGKFVRSNAQFRNWVTADGSTGPSGESGFKAESGRYHLYVSLACPWAHRTLVFRKLKKLESHISVSVVHTDMMEKGWTFEGPTEGNFGVEVKDHLYGFKNYYEIYTKAQPDYSGRVTVPVLWDKHQQTIVSNESSEIIRMLNSAFNEITGDTQDFYPEPLRAQIDDINDRVYHTINNGVYKCGFATSQEAYEEAYEQLFETLEWLETLLGDQRYLAGDQITEADWRLFTTLVRFDPVYVGHFKCNKTTIAACPNLQNYLRELYQIPGISETVNIGHIKRHYYFSHRSINPHGVIPKGPKLSFDQPHNRDAIHGS